MSERRRDKRNTVIKTVRIVFEDAVIRGTALDLSPSGAKVCVPPGAEVPSPVLLYLPDGTVKAANVRWRDGADVGFEFLGHAQGGPGGTTDPPLVPRSP